MIAKQSGKAIRAFDMSVFYGGYKLSKKARIEAWFDRHASGLACTVATIALIGAFWYYAVLWFEGVI